MRIFRSVSFILIQFLVCALILNYGSSFFLTHSSNALYRTRMVLQPDPDLGWKLYPNLGTQFEKVPLFSNQFGERISTANENTNSNSDFVLTLGPSSAFGWGVKNEDTYTSLFANAAKLNALNASQIGYSSFQGELLWKNFISQKPQHFKYALLAYGINDLDKFRFYGQTYNSDTDFFSQVPLHFSKLLNWQKNFDFLKIINVASDEISLKFNCAPLAQIQQRATLEIYLAKMQNLITELKDKSIIPIVINTPYYLKKKNLLYSKNAIEARYEKVKNLAKEGSCTEALTELAAAKSLEPDRVAEDVVKLNSDLRELAEKNKAVYIDAYTILNSNQTNENYVDPVHPSAHGHLLIAGQIQASVLK